MAKTGCIAMVLLTLGASLEGGEAKRDPVENESAEVEAAMAVCRGVLDALGNPEGMDEAAVLDRFLIANTEGKVWYVCLPEECNDSILDSVTALANLTYLAAGNTKITDAGAKQLGELKSLKVLHLWDTQLTDAGLEGLKELKGLTLLNLGGTGVTDKGIAQLEALENLQELRLHGTKVTDEALDSLKKLKNLQKVWLQDTEVSAAAVGEFRKSFSEDRAAGSAGDTPSAPPLVFHDAKDLSESPGEAGGEEAEDSTPAEEADAGNAEETDGENPKKADRASEQEQDSPAAKKAAAKNKAKTDAGSDDANDSASS